jgi:hypothetical protein
MSSRANRARFVVLAIVALTGCQSGPRWAFWKHDTTPENASLVAHAAPALPSTQSVPQTATVAASPVTAVPLSASSIAAATPPSANSLATAGITPASIAIPTTTPATASPYPTTTPSSGYTGIGAAVPASATSPGAAHTATGPYDPNGYHSAAAGASPASADPLSISPPETDRYGVIPPSPAGEPDRYTMVPDAPLTASAPPNANMPGRERYGAAAPDAPMTSVPQTPAAIAAISGADPDRYAAAPAASTSISPQNASSAATPSAAATVRISAPAGQYRPGGTSTYTGSPTSGIEVASRPTTSTASTVSMPSGDTITPSTAPGAGTKTY